MRLTDFKVLSFDCYGTLIDWETGICAALQPLAARSGQAFTRDQLLESHARHEAAQEAATPELRYADLLARVHDRIAGEWGLAPDPEESRAYGLSVRDWPAFPDSAAALQYREFPGSVCKLPRILPATLRRSIATGARPKERLGLRRVSPAYGCKPRPRWTFVVATALRARWRLAQLTIIWKVVVAGAAPWALAVTVIV